MLPFEVSADSEHIIRLKIFDDYTPELAILRELKETRKWRCKEVTRQSYGSCILQ